MADLHTVPVHVTNADDFRASQELGHQYVETQGYPLGTFTLWSAPLLGQGVKPQQVLTFDERRNRALILSLDQDIYLSTTEAELVLSTGSALPQGGYWPKLTPLEIKNFQPLYIVSAASGATRITVLSESSVK